jgi:DNA polymerase-1
VANDANNARILKEYGFWSLVRLLPLKMTTGLLASGRVRTQVTYRAVRNQQEMSLLEARISECEVCATDTEASDKDPRSASLLGVAFSAKAGEAFYVPLTECDLRGASPEAMKAGLNRIFAGRARFIGHNLKFDCVLLEQHGIRIKHAFFDTMLAAYDCFGDLEFFNLGALAKRFLGKDIRRYKDIVGRGETLLDVPFNELLDHACADADMTLQLYDRLRRELESRGLFAQFSGETMPLLRALVGRECNGVRLNIRAVRRRREVLASEAEALRRAVITHAGKEFNLESLTETATVLQEINPVAGLTVRRLTRAQLEQLAGMYLLPRLIVKYGRLKKLERELATICESAKDVKVFPVFSQVRWPHGALSSTDPRICGPDGALAATAVIDRTIRERMDDGNRSLEIVQRTTGDAVLRRALRHGVDHHCLVGRTGVEQDLDMRDFVLSVASGLSDAELSSRFLIDRPTAAGMRQGLESKYVALFKWLDTYRKNAMTRGFAYHDGKRKYLEGLRSSDIDKRRQALVSAVRWVIRY